MVVQQAVDYYRREGARTLLNKSEQWLKYRYKQYTFSLEKALLDDRYLYHYTVWRNQRGVDAAADPRELRYVNPMEIQRITSFHPHFCWRKIGAVRAGDWDLNLIELEDKFEEIYRALEARYVNGRKWEDIPIVQDVLEGNRHWHHHTGEEIWEWCDHLDRLFESIQTDGYLAEREVLDMTFSEACESKTVSIIEWMDDVRVDIGRDGELLRHDGKHRLWFAQLLNIERIPVCVVVRHEQWQELRDEIAQATTVDELSERARQHLDHPDLVDVRRSLEG